MDFAPSEIEFSLNGGFRRGEAPSEIEFSPSLNGESKGGEASLIKILPLHAKNTSPYFGEGDKGDRVTIKIRG